MTFQPSISKICLVTALFVVGAANVKCGDGKRRDINAQGALAYCTKASDTSGQGFGMENRKRCLVPGGKADPLATKNAPGAAPKGETTLTPIAMKPAAKPASSGPQTPVPPSLPEPAPAAKETPHPAPTIVGGTHPANNDSSPQPAADKWCDPVHKDRCFPYCVHGSLTDSDGDGWGYENGASCKVPQA